jgi:hypothetical protein
MRFLVLSSILVCCQSMAAAQLPPRSSSQNFKLVAHVTGSDLTPSIENWELTSYHITPCYDYAVLTEASVNGGGRIFYVNGTADEVSNGEEDMLSDGGTPPTPYGIFLGGTDSTDRRPVQITCGRGTGGVDIVSGPRGVPQLNYGTGKSNFYACNSTLPSGPAIEVFLREGSEPYQAGCANITLIAKCASATPSHSTAANSKCCVNVSGGRCVN